VSTTKDGSKYDARVKPKKGTADLLDTVGYGIATTVHTVECYQAEVLILNGKKPCYVQKAKTYNRRDSQMVTHSSTSRPVQCLCMAERTGCPVLTDLWSYVLVIAKLGYNNNNAEAVGDVREGIERPD
jgi:hypothetical protein